MFNSVMAATVTYGDRWDYLRQLIQRLEQIKNVEKLIIFGNGVQYSIQDRIDATFQQLRISIEVVTSTNNLGSAGGFKELLLGCEEYKTQYEHILLLDDDNLPEISIFLNLENDVINEHISLDKSVFSFYRERYDGQLFKKNRVWMKEKYKNTYCKFAIFNKIFPNIHTEKRTNSSFIQVPYSQYSGLIFPIGLLSEIGLPNSDYYLYVDDTDFSYRMTLFEYRLFVYKKGKIIDLENSWSQIAPEKEINPHKSIFHGDVKRGLYYIRNRVYFESKYLVTSKAMYHINLWIYYVCIFIFFMPKNKTGLNVYLKMVKAVKDGMKGKLGEIHG